MMNKMMILMAAAAFGLAAGAQAYDTSNFVDRLATGKQQSARHVAQAKPTAQAKSTRVAAAQAKPAAPQLKYTNYKLADGTVVEMSNSQKGIANGLWQKPSSEVLYQVAAQISVVVVTEFADGTTGQGTGFFINATDILTNWHMVRNAKHITIIDSTGTKYSDGYVRIENMSLDVACVRFSTSRASTARNQAWFVTDSNWERPGERVYVFGNPEGYEWSFVDGLLSAYRANGALFQISAPLGHGSSGSPVFNEYGLVIGMIRGGLDKSTAGISFAISADALFEAVQITNSDHPKGFNLGITNGVELRSKEDIELDNSTAQKLADAARVVTPEMHQAFERIITDVRLCAKDTEAFDVWAAKMRELGPWGINASYWVPGLIDQASDRFERAIFIADVNTLLKLQGRDPLSVGSSPKLTDDQIRAENDKAMEARKQRDDQTRAENEKALQRAKQEKLTHDQLMERGIDPNRNQAKASSVSEISTREHPIV